MTIQLNTKELAKLGTEVERQLSQFRTDRNLLETQWLKNLRQYQGKYDDAVAANIPDERSHVYPRDTRIKIKGGVAKMMEMMFPAQDRNWGLSVSPIPNIPKEDLQRVIDGLTLQAQGQPVDSDSIERAVRAFAEDRKDKMEVEIDDQLNDPGIDYPQLCKRVVRSGYIYGIGVARSPMVRTQTERVWTPDPENLTYRAVTKTIRRPYPEYVRIWDIYPDLTARTWEDQEMLFERMVLTRHDVTNLQKRPDFIKVNIKEYLRDFPHGNYTAQTFDAELQQLDKTANLADRTARRYEVYRAFGFVSGHTLRSVGIEISEEELSQDILADIWVIGNTVIKAQKAAFGDSISDHYHAFVYAEDEDSGLTGVGLPEEIRDSQMSLCASTRALMDNMASTAGPIFEVNQDLLPVGRKDIGAIHAFKTIYREGEMQDAQFPAIRAITTDSHVSEILSIISMQRQQLDIESNLPSILMGNAPDQLGEAFRTSQNMSMMMGSANMVTKDTVRAFDKFTTSLIQSMLDWNMEFNPKDEIKGDYQVVAKGNISLVAKEVRGAALDQFVTTLSPEERAILDTYGLLVDRLKSRDLPTDRLLPREEAERIMQGMQESASQASQVEQGLTKAKADSASAVAENKRADTQLMQATADATIQEILSRVEANLANAKSNEDKMQLENLRTLLSTATGETQPQPQPAQEAVQ
jgi:hypothetical protein